MPSVGPLLVTNFRRSLPKKCGAVVPQFFYSAATILNRTTASQCDARFLRLNDLINYRQATDNFADSRYRDWNLRELREEGKESEIEKRFAGIADHIAEFLKKEFSAVDWLPPEEQRKRKEAEARRRAEDERQRREAEATRREERDEEARRKAAAEAQARERADEERRRREAEAEQRRKVEAETERRATSASPEVAAQKATESKSMGPWGTAIFLSAMIVGAFAIIFDFISKNTAVRLSVE
jgi:cobalamin biosynthesis Mg chelatase CobN